VEETGMEALACARISLHLRLISVKSTQVNDDHQKQA